MDVDLEAAAVAALLRQNPDISTPRVFTHYLYFKTRRDAITVAEDLRLQGFETNVGKSSYGQEFLVSARHLLPPRLHPVLETRRNLERMAREGGGEYDGWEAIAAANQEG